ncbi:MAG: hypothetical protein U9O82_13420 [Thermodesulfobacteriota bacterium]|nr:hypothetical protein [Thermodesulfobacteriota bacterium]
MQTTKIIILAAFFYLTNLAAAGATTVAVFPVEDLSHGRNGVDLKLTGILSEILAEKGLDVVSEPDVISFMAKNRIRWLGYMYSNHIFEARDYLGADLILLGTLCQRKRESIPLLGLTLSLIRTEDGVTIWSNSRGVSHSNTRRILGIGEPDSVDDLMPHIVKEIMTGWPERLGQTLPPEKSDLELDSWSLTGKYVRPGEKIGAMVRFSLPKDSGKEPRVFFREGNRLHLALKSPETGFYEATWLSSYREGVYPVNVLLRWSSGDEKTSFLEEYCVDGRPPNTRLNIKGLASRENVMRDKVVIMPSLQKKEQIARWKISIEDQEGKTILAGDGKGNIPDKFLWKGQTSGGNFVDKGTFNIILKAWDLADNESITSQEITISRTLPVVELTAKKQDKNILVNIQHTGEIPISFWQIEIWSIDNVLLKQTEGNTLPADVNLSFPDADVPDNIECMIIVRDILGNQTKKEVKNPFQLVGLDETHEEKPVEEEWNLDF